MKDFLSEFEAFVDVLFTKGCATSSQAINQRSTAWETLLQASDYFPFRAFKFYYGLSIFGLFMNSVRCRRSDTS